ncbi:hypothetical protein CBL_04020 [Carabus blaptoides fortunei]
MYVPDSLIPPPDLVAWWIRDSRGRGIRHRYVTWEHRNANASCDTFRACMISIKIRFPSRLPNRISPLEQTWARRCFQIDTRTPTPYRVRSPLYGAAKGTAHILPFRRFARSTDTIIPYYICSTRS